MNENAFFKLDNPAADTVAGFSLPHGWWSRGYEYLWASQFNNPLGGYFANMGAGYTYRPLSDMLAQRAGLVYSVDAKKPTWNLLEHPIPPNVQIVQADMANIGNLIPPQSLDRIFCISVLEETGDGVPAILKEFARLITFEGLIVLTFDVQADMSKPLGQWSGLKFETFIEGCEAAGLAPRSDLHMDMDNALVNEDFNLACFHCVLVKK